MDFVHLHVHSHFSLEEGVAPPEALVMRARELGMRALALTDHNSLAGVVAFCTACRTHGIRPVIGAELDVLPFETKVTSAQLFRLVLLAENEAGYRNLVRLVQRAHTAPVRGNPAIRLDDLKAGASGLIVLTGGEHSELYHLVASGRAAETETHITELVRIFSRENVVFEVQNFGVTGESPVAGQIVRLAEFLSMRCVATNDVCFLYPEDSICYEFLRRDAPPSFLSFLERRDPLRHRHLASPADMMRKFQRTPQVIRSTVDISERCGFVPNLEKKRFPSQDFVRGFDADSYLWDLTFREARARFTELTSEMKNRLNEEFDYLKNEGLSNNILLLWNIAQFCRRSRIALGVGRGNTISSLIAHILGITQVNPLDYKLRFLGFEGETPQDRCLTVEIPSSHARRLHEFLRENFGANFCSAVGRWLPASKTSLAREICQWFHLPFTQVAALVEEWDDRAPHGEATLERFVPHRGDGVALPNRDVVRFMLARLLPRPRQLACAEQQFAISGENLNGLVPRVPAEDELVTQMDAAALDGFNIPRVRIDSSPLLNIIDTAARWVREQEHAKFDPERIPPDDDDTYSLLARGLTNGIDPFHSITMKSLLREHRPRNLMGLLKLKAMEKTPDADRAPDVREHLPECLLTYRCAFIKAHYPMSFMTALLTHSYPNRKKFTVILREAKQMGIRILPPDINRSFYEFSLAPRAIRTGLMVVSGLGEKAYAEIERVRMGGNFNNLLDLIRRTDPRLVNNRVLANLARTGALDVFNLKRSQLLSMIEDQADFARKDGAAPSLFDGQDDLEGLPALDAPDIPELSEGDIIRNEIAAAGYCISFDQLHFYKGLIRQCRALSPYELSAKYVGREVHLAGFIEHADSRSPLIDETEQVLLDMEGRVVVMALKAAKLYEAALQANAPVLVGGTVHRRKDEVYLKALTAFTLRQVQQMSRQVLELTLDLSGENLRTVRLIRSLVRQYRTGGTTLLRIENFAGSSFGRWYAGAISGAKVFFSPPFYQALKLILPEEQMTLTVAEDTDPDLLHALSPSRFPRAEKPGSPPEPEENSSVIDAY
ncbi:MAG: PHP domain-containing protein [Candidatus Sumerlaeaceae bacterium]|nr:PHP domain-containing protein [Candidatus Sumerlaeaceae bacterium]